MSSERRDMSCQRGLLDESRLVRTEHEQSRLPPEAAASTFSRCTFSWLNDLFRADQRSPSGVREEDLCDLLFEDRSSYLEGIVLSSWAEELQKPVGRRSLARALARAVATPFVVAGWKKLVYDFLQLASPICLQCFLDSLSFEGRSGRMFASFGWVFLLVFLSLVRTFLFHSHIHVCFRTGMRLRGAASLLLFRKALALPGSQRSGETVNKMAIDAQRLQDACPYLHMMWSAPLQVIMALFYLHHIVGWSMLGGFILLCLQIPFFSLMGRWAKKLQKQLMQQKDHRLETTAETLRVMKLLKMYAWDDAFEDRITKVRHVELRYLRRFRLWDALLRTLSQRTPSFAALATLTTFCFFEPERFTASAVFPALAVFAHLQFPIEVLPRIITVAVEGHLALKRIQSLLEEPSIPVRSQSSLPQNVASEKPVIEARDLVAAWPNGTHIFEQACFTIACPDPSAESSRICAILGPVGSGKTALLLAALQELSIVEGTIDVAGSVALCTQSPWIQNATVCSNVLFGKEYHSTRYHATLEACSLQHDLQQLPGGDQCEIGERGVTLSGGQRHRVALARALYSDAEVILLDDPLSALDAHVATNVFKALRCHPLLYGRLVVLVTHRIDLCFGYCDQVLRVSQCKQVENSDTGDAPEFELHSDGNGSVQDANANGFSTQIQSDAAVRQIKREEVKEGSVSRDVVWLYAGQLGGILRCIVALTACVLSQSFISVADGWISVWTSDPLMTAITGSTTYAGILVFSVGVALLANSMCSLLSVRAAGSLHTGVVAAIVKQPMSFFDTTLQGTILNRLSKDIYVADEQIMPTISSYISLTLRVLSTVVIIAGATPWFLLFIGPLFVCYKRIQDGFVPTQRQVRRLESKLRSPVFSHFQETLEGRQTIRAFAVQSDFIEKGYVLLDANMRGHYTQTALTRWLGVRLECLSALIIFIAGTLAVLAGEYIAAGVVGLSMTYALNVTNAFQWRVRTVTELETNFVAIERLMEYLLMPCECNAHVDHRVSTRTLMWPSAGKVEFRDVSMRYRAGLPDVLRHVSFVATPGEHIGICGRTGGGKSSIFVALLRLAENTSGAIFIDDVDTSCVSLPILRNAVTIIPQDPVLFSGSVAFNLDPLGKSSDGEMRTTLEQCFLATKVDDAKPLADQQVELSAGEKQLLCLGRALLRSTKVLLLDEATSSVDTTLDAHIQSALHRHFGTHTVLCIAHRISTILDSSRIIVLEAGQIVESGIPEELQQRPHSKFASFVQAPEALPKKCS